MGFKFEFININMDKNETTLCHREMKDKKFKRLSNG